MPIWGRVFGVDASIEDLSLAQLQALDNVDVPTLEEAVDLAAYLGAGLYIEIKGDGANQSTLALLQHKRFNFATLGSFQPDHLSELAALGCPYPLAILVGPNHDPFAIAEAARADVMHLCWERASDRPDRLLDNELMDRARMTGLPIVLWHEERPDVILEVMKADVIGVCSNRPELLVPYAGSPARPSDQPKGPEVVCHRGINKLAPENTLAAARLVFEQGFDWLELDVQQTKDNQLVVIHDDTLERTTNGTGPVSARTLADLRQLDAGGWVSTLHAGEQIPTLAEMIDLAKDWNKRIYIELKKADPRLVLDLVRAMDFLEDCFFWSFDWPRVETLRALEPRANIMVRTQDHSSIDALFDATAPDIVEITINEANQDKIDQIRAQGAKAMICYMG